MKGNEVGVSPPAGAGRWRGLRGQGMLCSILYCTVLYCHIHHCTVQSSTVQDITVQHCTLYPCHVASSEQKVTTILINSIILLCCVVLYGVVLCCVVLYCIVLCCVVLVSRAIVPTATPMLLRTPNSIFYRPILNMKKVISGVFSDWCYQWLQTIAARQCSVRYCV
jgi:hypothetical protein